MVEAVIRITTLLVVLVALVNFGHAALLLVRLARRVRERYPDRWLALWLPAWRSPREALAWLGWEDVSLSPRGTADHNIAIRMGIPAVAIGVTTGEGAHTPTEYADVDPFTTGVKQILLLIASDLY